MIIVEVNTPQAGREEVTGSHYQNLNERVFCRAAPLEGLVTFGTQAAQGDLTGREPEEKNTRTSLSSLPTSSRSLRALEPTDELHVGQSPGAGDRVEKD